MALSTDNITEVFPGSSINTNGDLVIASGAIRSFNPEASQTTGAVEMMFGLIDTIASVVSTGAMTNMTVAQSDRIVDANTLRKDVAFRVNLSYDGDVVDAILDVKAEPQE